MTIIAKQVVLHVLEKKSYFIEWVSLRADTKVRVVGGK